LVVYILYAIFFISALALIASVLLQPGKTDAGALFTSNISSSAFNPRGTQTVLSKITIAAAVGFMLSALLISMPALTGDVSVLNTTTAEAPVTAPADANSNTNTENPAGDANANTLDVNSSITGPPANVNVNAASNATPPPVAKAANSANAPVKKDAPKAPEKKK
jgi:preprotein translocase subunit SecG